MAKESSRTHSVSSAHLKIGSLVVLFATWALVIVIFMTNSWVPFAAIGVACTSVVFLAVVVYKSFDHTRDFKHMFSYVVNYSWQALCTLRNLQWHSLRGVLDKNIQVCALLGLRETGKPQGTSYIWLRSWLSDWYHWLFSSGSRIRISKRLFQTSF